MENKILQTSGIYKRFQMAYERWTSFTILDEEFQEIINELNDEAEKEKLPLHFEFPKWENGYDYDYYPEDESSGF